MNSVICEFCDSSISKHNIAKHKKSETCIKIQGILNKKDILYNELWERYKQSQNKIKELEQEITILKKYNEEKDFEIKTLENKSEEYRKIVEKCAVKSTTTTNVVNNNKNTYNHLNYISSEPINFKELKNELSKVITTKSMFYDDEDFNNHIINNILKDENGKDKVLCTDINRKNFSYKDENSGELISDPELENLRERLRKGVDINIIRQELLSKIILKYKDNPNIEPYEKLYFLMNKLEFGDPFVSQMARKTYIKTKSCIENL